MVNKIPRFGGVFSFPLTRSFYMCYNNQYGKILHLPFGIIITTRLSWQQ
ncbi:hypothetical protein ETECTG_CDS0208 [Escherichia phage ETEC-TG]|nr:hypothetical protein [Escherichia phage vB_EcoM_EP57]WPK30723.1 hypothetical protein ETECTG_CDS0208 [Escherichia phage ETEC-TG]